MKASDGAHHCLPTFFKLCSVNYVMLGYGYVTLGYVRFGSVRFDYIRFLYFITQKLGVSP